jgi:coiled-coil domain-containing protein 61
LFIDLLTYSDLESLKAKKTGNTSTISTGASINTALTSKSQLKRYIILTYTGEYDRVHYPLPLSFEETPNVDALKRTIRRLRALLDGAPKDPNNRSIIDGSLDP